MRRGSLPRGGRRCWGWGRRRGGRGSWGGCGDCGGGGSGRGRGGRRRFVLVTGCQRDGGSDADRAKHYGPPQQRRSPADSSCQSYGPMTVSQCGHLFVFTPFRPGFSAQLARSLARTVRQAHLLVFIPVDGLQPRGDQPVNLVVRQLLLQPPSSIVTVDSATLTLHIVTSSASRSSIRPKGTDISTALTAPRPVTLPSTRNPAPKRVPLRWLTE